MPRPWPWSSPQRPAQPGDIWAERAPLHTVAANEDKTSGTVTGYRETGREAWVLSVAGHYAEVESRRGSFCRRMEVLAKSLRSPRWALTDRRVPEKPAQPETLEMFPEEKP